MSPISTTDCWRTMLCFVKHYIPSVCLQKKAMQFHRELCLLPLPVFWLVKSIYLIVKLLYESPRLSRSSSHRLLLMQLFVWWPLLKDYPKKKNLSSCTCICMFFIQVEKNWGYGPPKMTKKKHHKSQKSSFTNNLALRIRTYSNWHVAFRYETWNIVHKSMVVKGMENSG